MARPKEKTNENETTTNSHTHSTRNKENDKLLVYRKARIGPCKVLCSVFGDSMCDATEQLNSINRLKLFHIVMIIIIKKIIVFTKPVSIKPITVGQSKRVCMLNIHDFFVVSCACELHSHSDCIHITLFATYCHCFYGEVRCVMSDDYFKTIRTRQETPKTNCHSIYTLESDLMKMTNARTAKRRLVLHENY